MTDSAHPDVAPFAQGDPISPEQRAEITTHLRECGECRDLVLFIRKTNATLRYEGRVSRVAWAMRMSATAPPMAKATLSSASDLSVPTARHSTSRTASPSSIPMLLSCPDWLGYNVGGAELP